MIIMSQGRDQWQGQCLWHGRRVSGSSTDHPDQVRAQSDVIQWCQDQNWPDSRDGWDLLQKCNRCNSFGRILWRYKMNLDIWVLQLVSNTPTSCYNLFFRDVSETNNNNYYTCTFSCTYVREEKKERNWSNTRILSFARILSRKIWKRNQCGDSRRNRQT